MDVATYLRGVGLLILIVAPLLWAGARLRGRLVPGWTGPPAWLASAVASLALLLGGLQLTGAVGQFRVVPVVAVCVALGLVVALACGTTRPAEAGEPPATRPAASRRGAVVAVLLIGLVVVPWAVRTVSSVNGGILDFDSLNYHLPFATRFVQTGHILPLQFTSPGSETPFDPANSELVHALGMLLFRRDILSPFVNLGWLALALLAAWCVGRRRGAALLTMAAAAVVLASPLMVSADAGSAKNDVIDLFLVLGAAALLLDAESRHLDGRRLHLGAVALAGAAAGMGLSNKLTLAIPVAALTATVVVVARRGQRLAVTAAWLGPLAATGAFWFVRNWALAGNPVPSLHLGVGSLAFPSPRLSQVAGRGFSVAHYLFDARVWRVFFVRGLARSLGSTWPLVALLAGAGVVAGVVRAPRLIRALAAAAVVAVAGYLVTPESAGGLPGRPDLFANNLRYAFPALALALVVAALVAGRMGGWVASLTLAALVVATVVEQLHWVHPHHLAVSDAWPPLAAGIGLTALTLATVALVGRRRAAPLGGPPRWTAAAALVALSVAGIGAVSGPYLHRRYADVGNWDGGRQVGALDAVYRWGRALSDTRIGVTGLDEQYPLAGTDLTNHVQYVGTRGPHGSFERATSCAAWRRAVDAGHYRYIVLAKDRAPGTPYEVRWTANDPAVSEIIHVDSARVFSVTGALDPRTCP